jgi:hypothetical protein
MNVRQLLAVAAAATLLLPGTALAGKGNGKPTGKPDTFQIRTLEGPVESPETVPAPTPETPETGDVVEVIEAPAADKAARKAAKKAAQAARKSAKRACKGLSKKRVKGKKGTPYSRCIVAASKRKPVAPAPVFEPAPVEPAPIPEPPIA